MSGRFRGASLDQAVEQALEGAGADGLCPPLRLARGSVDATSADTLAAWGVFNPFGSSRVRLLSLEVSGTRLLVHEVAHARHPRATLHGLASDDLLSTLRALFADRAEAGSEPVLPVPPTHVDLAASQLSEDELRSLLCESLAGRQELDLESCCRLIEAHGADVKERTKDELRAALGTVMDIHAGVHRPPGPPSKELLARWWQLVTDAELGVRERAAIDELGGGHLSVRPPLEAPN